MTRERRTTDSNDACSDDRYNTITGRLSGLRRETNRTIITTAIKNVTNGSNDPALLAELMIMLDNASN